MAQIENNKDFPAPDLNSSLKESRDLLGRLNKQEKERQSNADNTASAALKRLYALKNAATPKAAPVQNTQAPKESTVSFGKPEITEEQPKNNLEKTIARLEQMSLKAQSEGVVMPEARTLLSQVKRLARGVENGTLNVDALSKLVHDYDGAPINPLDKPVRFLRGIAKMAKKVGIAEVGASAYPSRDLLGRIYMASQTANIILLTPEEDAALTDYIAANPAPVATATIASK